MKSSLAAMCIFIQGDISRLLTYGQVVQVLGVFLVLSFTLMYVDVIGSVLIWKSTVASL